MIERLMRKTGSTRPAHLVVGAVIFGHPLLGLLGNWYFG